MLATALAAKEAKVASAKLADVKVIKPALAHWVSLAEIAACASLLLNFTRPSWKGLWAESLLHRIRVRRHIRLRRAGICMLTFFTTWS